MQRPVREFAGHDFVQLPQTMRVSEALDFIRDYRSPGQSLIYFYVVDDASRLVGVLQTRALLTAQPEESLTEVMIRRVIAIPVGVESTEQVQPRQQFDGLVREAVCRVGEERHRCICC